MAIRGERRQRCLQNRPTGWYAQLFGRENDAFQPVSKWEAQGARLRHSFQSRFFTYHLIANIRPLRAITRIYRHKCIYALRIWAGRLIRPSHGISRPTYPGGFSQHSFCERLGSAMARACRAPGTRGNINWRVVRLRWTDGLLGGLVAFAQAAPCFTTADPHVCTWRLASRPHELRCIAHIKWSPNFPPGRPSGFLVALPLSIRRKRRLRRRAVPIAERWRHLVHAGGIRRSFWPFRYLGAGAPFDGQRGPDPVVQDMVGRQVLRTKPPCPVRFAGAYSSFDWGSSPPCMGGSSGRATLWLFRSASFSQAPACRKKLNLKLHSASASSSDLREEGAHLLPPIMI